MKSLVPKILRIFVPLSLFSVFALQVYAMQSSSYSIQSDSINFGGDNSSSNAYIVGDTLGEIATGLSSSTNYGLRAGFRQMDSVYLTIIPAGDVVMSPAIGGVTGGSSNGQTSFKVITDNPAGYSAYIKASTSPAMKSTLDQVTDATTVIQFVFPSIPTDAYFGFTPEGSEIANTFKDNGLACGVSSLDTIDSCWSGLNTSNILVAGRTSGNQPSGASTTLKFKVNVGNQRLLRNGAYQADITITVVPL